MQFVRRYDLLIRMPPIIREWDIGSALRTSTLLLNEVKPLVISLSVAGMLNIHGKGLNLWINMHILCRHSHVEMYSIAPIDSTIQIISVFLCPFHFAYRQLLSASSLLWRIITNEPVPVFSGSFFPMKFTWKQIYWFSQTRQMELWSFSPDSHLEPRTPCLCWCGLCELDGGSCLFISIQLLTEISL